MLTSSTLKFFVCCILCVLTLSGCFGGGNLNPLIRNKPIIDLSKYGSSSSYCPKVELRDGTESMNVYEHGFENDPMRLVHQARIVRTARECRRENGQLIMRIGINGHVLTGPRGGPARLQIPIRVVVLKFQESVIYSDLHPVSVQISDFDPTPDFVTVVDVSVPDPDEERNYLVYVGIDTNQSE